MSEYPTSFAAHAPHRSGRNPRFVDSPELPYTKGACKDSAFVPTNWRMDNGDYDFIIIGSGAGGGTLAYHLAPSGKRILLLERGPFVPREKENWNSLEVNARGRYNTKELWRNADGSELHPHTNYYVGGNTKFYGAALFRLREEDFGEIKHYGGISPAWPISYEELEPYYVQAERLYHVHGEIGEDPTEPHRSGAFPYPAISHEPRIQQLSDDFRPAWPEAFSHATWSDAR